jgi:poly-gamma-glutamate synthesis protein (capsule biosynthesis protein)
VFKGEPEHVAGLTVVPFEVACLGNNHTLDYGVAGLRETLRLLHRNGIRTVGAGLTEEEACCPLRLTVRGVRVHVVNFSEGEDLTAASGGPAAFRAVADAGADCVIGHHPHVPQGIEWYHGRPIVYSLGNFVFYQPVSLHHRKTGFCVSLQLERDVVSGIELHPYRITDTGLRMLDDKEAREFLRTMARISRPFRTKDGPARAWDAYLDYYGLNGFTNEVSAILDRMKIELPKGAAMFRNRVTTMQHAELWKDALTRMIEEKPRRPPREAAAVVEEWFTQSLD